MMASAKPVDELIKKGASMSEIAAIRAMKAAVAAR